MTLFSTIFHKNRRFLNFGLATLLFFSVTLSKDDVRPLLGNVASTLFYSPFFRFKSNVEDLQRVAEENRNLRNQLAQMSMQLGALSEARRENERLRQFIGFQPPGNYRLVPVKIVSVLQHFYPIAAVINKGRDDNIFENQPVVNRFGLVGRIKEVMSNNATVQLLTDPANAVSVRVADSRQIGIVRFSPDNGMILDNLPADAQIKKGDLIISSGLGGIYPAGVAVAITDSVFANTGEILKTVRLRPTVDFFEIDELYVLTSYLR
jgi:rod shape-determining protein MreC